MISLETLMRKVIFIGFLTLLGGGITTTLQVPGGNIILTDAAARGISDSVCPTGSLTYTANTDEVLKMDPRTEQRVTPPGEDSAPRERRVIPPLRNNSPTWIPPKLVGVWLYKDQEALIKMTVRSEGTYNRQGEITLPQGPSNFDESGDIKVDEEKFTCSPKSGYVTVNGHRDKPVEQRFGWSLEQTRDGDEQLVLESSHGSHPFVRVE
jgi:hypothetical protein